MAIVAARRSRPNPAFERCADIPDGFDVSFASQARLSGVHELPISIWWSSKDRSFDLANEETRTFVYERVLHEGTSVDVLAFVQPAELVRLWPRMRVTAAVADVWDPWVQAQCR